MSALRVLIVDDEVHARRGLKSLLKDERDVEVLGEVANGRLAVDAIRSLKPDLVFLDVEMPGLNGMEVVRVVGPEAMPAVIFITAYDQYAVAAFEANALDYLLKPFSDERFAAALQRARRAIDPDDLSQRLRQLLQATTGREEGEPPLRFTVRTGDVLSVFKAEEIDWVEADEYYAKLHIGGRVHMVRQTMHALEEQLPAAQFVRIHRSTIVNLDRIVALEPMFQGDYTVILTDGTRLRMSRRRRDVIAHKLKHFA